MSKKEKARLKALKQESEFQTAWLSREIELCNDSRKILDNRWNDIVSSFKDTTLKNQIMLHRRALSRNVDFKDKLIARLLDELDQVSLQRNRAYRDNAELMDNALMAIKGEMENVHAQYQARVKEILPVNLAEMEVRMADSNNSWTRIKYFEWKLRRTAKKNSDAVRQAHIEKMNLENGRLNTVLDKFRRKQMFHCRSLVEEHHALLTEYEEKTSEIRNDYQDLREKDENSFNSMHRLDSKINDIQNEISNLNKKIKKSASYAEMNQLLVEKEVFQKGYKRFFQKVIDISQHGFNQLSVLCQCTSEVYKVLNVALDKCDTFMKVAKLCQQMRLQEEKIEMSTKILTNDDIDLPVCNAALENLQQFWNRVSNVKINTALLCEETEKLKKENIELKNKIRKLVLQNV